VAIVPTARALPSHGRHGTAHGGERQERKLARCGEAWPRRRKRTRNGLEFYGLDRSRPGWRDKMFVRGEEEDGWMFALHLGLGSA
jgi:hypothetical protein